MIEPTCPFCMEQSHPDLLAKLLEVDWPLEHRTIHANEHVLIIPGLAPQIYPYALVLPRKHVISWTELTVTEHNSLVSGLKWLLSTKPFAGKGLLVAEHGGVFPSGSCMEHCHLHITKPICSPAAIMKGIANATPYIGERLRCNVPYVMAAHFDGEIFKGFYVEETCGGNQFYRRMLAEAVSANWWDWRERRNTEWMLRLISEVGGLALNLEVVD